MAVNTNILPASDDLTGWKAVDAALNKRIGNHILPSSLMSSPILRLYFGSKNDAYLLDKYEHVAVIHAFIEWLTNDYRPARRRKIEKKKKGKNRSQRKHTRLGKTLA